MTVVALHPLAILADNGSNPIQGKHAAAAAASL
jgi:hypothetical protein